LLAAEMEEENRKANPNAAAAGTVVESRVSKNEGSVATILIQNGTLKTGDSLTFNNQHYGKARALKNYLGENVEKAGPSAPIKIIGLKISPQVGDILEVGIGEKVKTKKIQTGRRGSMITKQADEGEDQIPKINIILKSDFLGSNEAIEESIEKINSAEAKVKIIQKGLGNITEGDVAKAEATGATIIGFHVNASAVAQEQARDKNVEIKKYQIIYDLINDFKAQLQELVIPEYKRVDLGRMKILAILLILIFAAPECHAGLLHKEVEVMSNRGPCLFKINKKTDKVDYYYKNSRWRKVTKENRARYQSIYDLGKEDSEK